MNSLHSSVISQVTHRLLTVLSLTVVVSFALWWFSAGNIPHNFTGQKHLLDLVLFLLVSYVIWHPIFMEILTWSISWHITETKEITPPKGLRVAFLTTIVPSNESLSLLHQCLPAMVNADYPHDTWLLDEGNSPEVKAICEQYGVFHFSRFRRRLYNTRKGKFVKKTKGGNHNSWYENFDADYDIVAQIDTDFVPQANFLTKTLGYFRDPNIAFVGTPQVYGNGEDSFIAKGAGEQLFSFYGTILRGLSGMKSSLLIGANHIIRVAALKDVDHYSAHITEDLLTGMKLHKKGWKSVYVPEILAVGEGPFTWEAYFAQQMRWAYGCMDILFYQSPKLFLTMGIRRTIYYFALQQHYFSGLAMGISLVLLSLYFATGVQAANVNNVLFMAFYSLIVLLSWLTSVWLQRYNVNQVESHELLLFGKMLSIASWPIYFIAFICAILRKRITYKVTPKGDSGTKFMESYRVFLPHFFFAFIALAGLLSSFFTHRQSAIMIFWALSTVVLMLCVPFMHLLTKAVNTASSRIAKVLSFIRTQNNRGEVLITQQQIQAEYTENALLLDMLFLGGIVVSSVLFYINKIGFYTDDWSFIGNFSVSKDQSLWGLFMTATTPNTFMRPLQNFYDALLYFAFGTQPLGYQVVNTYVMIGIVLLCYLILKHLNIPRIIAVSAPLIFILLPNYSTDRFWFAAFQVNLSMLFYLLSLLCALIAVDSKSKHSLKLKFLSVISLMFCGLSYEVAIPLFLLNVLILWYPREIITQTMSTFPRFKKPDSVFIILILTALVYVLLFKLVTTIRLGTFNAFSFPLSMLESAFRVNYGTFVIHLPYIWSEMMTRYFNLPLLYATGAVFLTIFLYLILIVTDRTSVYPTTSWFRNTGVLSVIIFIFGYAIFFTNSQVGFSPTGIENRVALAASLGVALTFVGAIGYILRKLLPEMMAKVCYALAVAVICAGGFLIINTLALFWGQAYQKGQAILVSIEKTYPTLPNHTVILIDGVCQNIGPAPTFEAPWDLKGALQSSYHNSTLQADVVTPRLEIKSDAIYSQIYTFRTKYSYEHIVIYNYKTNKSYQIRSMKEALAYFHTHNPDLSNGCPVNRVGHGTDVL